MCAIPKRSIRIAGGAGAGGSEYSFTHCVTSVVLLESIYKVLEVLLFAPFISQALLVTSSFYLVEWDGEKSKEANIHLTSLMHTV